MPRVCCLVSEHGRLVVRGNPVTGRDQDLLLPAQQSCTNLNLTYCEFDSGAIIS